MIVIFILVSNFATAQINFTNSQAASLVVGQANFTANVPGCTQNGFSGPSYTAISSKGVLAVSEQTFGRVKLWNSTPSANGANASVVVGKTGFTVCTNVGPNQSNVSNSNGVAFSPDGNKLIVTDFSHNRVLIWNTIPTVNGQNADIVLGQSNFTSSSGGVSDTAMNGPTGAFVSSDGRLIIADRGNNRILIWNSIPTTNNKSADVVVGQTVFNSPGGGSSATTMVNPWGVCVSPDGKLLVADSANNRVLVWNTIPTTNGAAADVVIGQTIMGTNGAGTTASNLAAPIGVTVSPSGKVAIGEFGNSRVLIYNSIPTTNGAAANVVLGQANFNSSIALYPTGSPTNNNMSNVYNASFDLYGRLYVVGREMNRVLVFGTAPVTQANLGIGITSNIATACLGTSNTITITISNATATAATGVIATASLPAGFTYSSHTASIGTYNSTSGYWNVGTVPASGTITLTINGVATASGDLSAYASIIQSNQLDPVLSNNGASVSYSIVGVVPPPTGSANQSFCNAAMISNLSVTGTSVLWYTNPTLGIPLSTSLSLVDGITYYASQTIGVCESTTRLPITVTIQPLNTYYGDVDGDGFGNPLSTTSSCVPVVGYVLNNNDCNDNQLQYLDTDGDGFGSTTQVPCGVSNNLDSNDNLLTYVDADNDGFGSTTFAPSGVTNTLDCSDNQLQYTDIDGDGFGVLPLVACGVTNSTDSNDDLLTYVDDDGDGFGSTTLAPSGSTNSLDCNDNQLQYADLDADGFGSTTQIACGVSNNLDCNDNEIQYLDADGDGFGSSTQVACGVSNNTDCNDNNNTINPGAIDVCGDGIDNDCNGIIDNVGQPGGCVPVLTNIQGSQCGTTLATIDQNIFANLVSGAQGYRFRVTRMIGGMPSTSASDVQTIDTFLRVFRITQLPSFAFNTTYQVEVSTRRNNVWQPFYGTPCTVTTPSPAPTIQSSQCGSTLTSMNDVIFANGVSFATGYRFRVVNLVTSQTYIVDRNLREFRMSLLSAPAAEFNSTYTVEVAIRNTNGTYLPYGSACNITTPSFPTTQIQTSQCDYNALSLTETIFADALSGVSAYRFRFLNGEFSYVLERLTRTFNLNMVPGIVAGTSYNVQVSVLINGVWGPYGKVCSLLVPGGDASKFAPNALPAAPSEVSEFKAVAYPNPFAENFKLDITTSSEANLQVKVYDMTGKLVEDKMLKASEIQNFELGDQYPSGVYNIILSQEAEVKTVRVIKR